jgi:hypothetical protein
MARRDGAPESPQRKARSGTNARNLALFSRELVIAELGERPEEFEELREKIRATFRPG